MSGESTARSPDELAAACVAHMWKHDTASPSLGMSIVSVGAGTATVAMKLREDMINGHGTAHGAFIFAVADSAFAFACNSHNERTFGVYCQISYLRPAYFGDELVAKAVEVERVGRSGIYDVTVSTKDEVVAVFRGHSRSVGPTVIE